MSYNKNTLNNSNLDAIEQVLDLLQYPYTISTFAEVRALGINDDYMGRTSYPLRRLSCDKFVVLEKMIRTEDCDTDDILTAVLFDPSNEPWLSDWKHEEYISEGENN